MRERIDRSTDENTYQPRIHADLIRELYRLKIETNLPITVLVNMALKDFIDKMDFERDVACEYDPDKITEWVPEFPDERI